MTETSELAGTLSAVAMRQPYAVFLLAVAICFLVAPQGVSKSRAALKPETSGPETIQGESPTQAVH